MAMYGKQYFDPENKEDQHFLEMQPYYTGAGNIYNTYKGLTFGGNLLMSKQEFASTMEEQGPEALELEDKINGPHMNKEEHKRYLEERKSCPSEKKALSGDSNNPRIRARHGDGSFVLRLRVTLIR